jgi:hypothetical protein
MVSPAALSGIIVFMVAMVFQTSTALDSGLRQLALFMISS